MPKDADLGPSGLPGDLRFREDGWSWAWIFAAPVFCALVALGSWLTGAIVQWFLLTVCALATMVCHAIIIAATRVHGRVQLSDTHFLQGTEAIGLSEIAGVYPPAGPTDAVSWTEARTLGELNDVPRRRTTLGLALASGAEVRVWARDAAGLRTELTRLVGEEEPKARSSEVDDFPDGPPGHADHSDGAVDEGD